MKVATLSSIFLIVFYIGLAFNNFYNVCINSNTLLIDLIIGSFASYDVLMSHMKMTVLLRLSQFTYFFLVLLYRLYSSVKYTISSFKSHTSFIFKYDNCYILYYFSILSFFSILFNLNIFFWPTDQLTNFLLNCV